MSFPGTVAIRVGRMAPNLPYPVNVRLPPTQPPDRRTEIRTVGPELDVVFLERAGKLNTKRNILVHGHWVLEANVLVRRGEAYLSTQFLREVIPTDPEDAQAMANPQNQKQRVRYTFTKKRIEGTTRDTNNLNREICEFMQVMKRKEIPLAEIPQLLLLQAPYQVTYLKP